MSSHVTLKRLPADAFYVSPTYATLYSDVQGLFSLFENMAFRRDLILLGPKGVGKSLSILAFAAREHIPVVSVPCSADMRRSHHLGQYIIQGGETPFVLGPLPLAFEIANETGKCILLLEEINALEPSSQKLLNMPTDAHRKVVVPECNRVFSLQPESKLWIVGTMNPSVYGGTYALNEDLKSRMRVLYVDYPKVEQEMTIVNNILGERAAQLDENRILKKIITLADLTRKKALDYALSTRDVVQVAEDVLDFGLNDSLRIMLGKFENEDKPVVREWVKSVFGVNLNSDSEGGE